jgi:putative ABC transport system permease protein
MFWVALRMLTGDRTKFFGLILGVSFATFLMTQQVSVFMGVVARSASQVTDVRDADLWVMDAHVRHIDEAPGLPSTALQRVRGVPGVAWAVPFYKGQVTARLPDGNFRVLVLQGVDDASLVGAPAEMVAGDVADLRRPNAVVIDKSGYEYLWPGEPIRLDREFEINERRAVLVGVCRASAPFVTLPIVYTRYDECRGFVPSARNLMNYVLARVQPGQDPEVVAQRITAETRLAAFTQDGFFWKTIGYFVAATGIPVNFGLTIAVGFLVGATVAGQTFYLFTIENLKHFGALKAMGVTNVRLIGMILLQAWSVGLIGYGLGVGLTAAFFNCMSNVSYMAGLFMGWYSMGVVALAIATIVTAAAFFSMRTVLFLEPAVVFRGA